MKNIKAMVMAAGMGSRLEPITLSMPKPLMPIMNIPIMDIILEHLKSAGVNQVISNTYYHSAQIINRYKNGFNGIEFNYIKETELSGTAGGMKKCQFFFNKGEDFIVMSGDLLTDSDLMEGLKIHKKSGAIATIGIKRVPKHCVSQFGVVVTDDNGYITEFQEKPDVENAKSDLINTGIYIFNYKIFDYIPENTFYDFAKNVFPKLLAEKQINTFKVDGYWNDIGTLEQYKQTMHDVFNGFCKIKHSPIIKTIEGEFVCGNSNIPTSVTISGQTVIGNNCKIGEYARLNNCVVMDNAIITSGKSYDNCIITPVLEHLKIDSVTDEKKKYVIMT